MGVLFIAATTPASFVERTLGPYFLVVGSGTAIIHARPCNAEGLYNTLESSVPDDSGRSSAPLNYQVNGRAFLFRRGSKTSILSFFSCLIVRPSSFAPHRSASRHSPFIVHPSSFAFHRSLLIIRPSKTSCFPCAATHYETNQGGKNKKFVPQAALP